LKARIYVRVCDWRAVSVQIPVSIRYASSANRFGDFPTLAASAHRALNDAPKVKAGR